MADPPLYAALLLIQLNFAIGAVVAALAMPKTEPLTFALIREVCAACLLTVYASKQGAPAAPPAWQPRVDGAPRRLRVRDAGAHLAIVGLKLSADPTAFALWQPAQPVAVAGVSIPSADGTGPRRAASLASRWLRCLLCGKNAQNGRRWSLRTGASPPPRRPARPTSSSPNRRRGATPVAVAAWAYSYAAVGTALSAAALWACGVSLCRRVLVVLLRARRSVARPRVVDHLLDVRRYALMMWCVKRRPTLVSAASALQPPLAAVCALIAIPPRRRRGVWGWPVAARRCADGPRRRRRVPDCVRRAGRGAVREERDDGVASGGVRPRACGGCCVTRRGGVLL